MELRKNRRRDGCEARRPGFPRPPLGEARLLLPAGAEVFGGASAAAGEVAAATIIVTVAQR
jgi:hypothetical protein